MHLFYIHWSLLILRVKSTLFAGLSMYIDGHTEVPYQELRRIICENGGRFEPYFSGSGITHFVAENLSHAKMRDL